MDIEKALSDPSSVFSTPAAVCDDPDLQWQQKVKILRQWEYDARELQVADEENMGGSGGVTLDEVLKALHQLGEGANLDNPPPIKQ
jgi:hypothetical protein